MKNEIDIEILKRLDAIVYLLLEIKDRDNKTSIKDKVKLLNEVGFDYNQIAKVLGKSPGNIAVQLNMLKKEEKSKENTKNKDSESTQQTNQEELNQDGS